MKKENSFQFIEITDFKEEISFRLDNRFLFINPKERRKRKTIELSTIDICTCTNHHKICVSKYLEKIILMYIYTRLF